MAEDPNLVAMTIEVVSNYVAHNNIRPEDVPDFIAKTHAAIQALAAPAEPASEPAAEPAEAHVPAVSARKSLASPDHIISMIDGRPYKTLKRHLSGHGLTPAQYRERYGLKPDYPMVAPAYSQHRRDVAKTLGLGKRAEAPAAEMTTPAAAETPTSSQRGRKAVPAADGKPSRRPRRPKADSAKKSDA